MDIPVLTFDHEAADFHDAVRLNNIALRDIKVDGYADAVREVSKELPDPYSVKESTELLVKHIPDISVACAVSYRMGALNKKDPTIILMLGRKIAKEDGNEYIHKSKTAEAFWEEKVIDAPFEGDEAKKMVAFFHFLGEYFFE